MTEKKVDNTTQRKYQMVKKDSWTPSDVIHTLRKNALLIAICTIIGLIIGIVMSVVFYMKGEMQKQYAITTSIAVTSRNAGGSFVNGTNTPAYEDIEIAEKLVIPAMYIIRSDRTLNATVDELELIGISTKDIYDNLNLSQHEDTPIIEITLYWRSADEGVKILDALNKVGPAVLMDVLKMGEVSVINDPKARYLIGGRFNASVWLTATFLGLAIGVAISLFSMIMNPTLLKSVDMEDIFDVEILAEIPERTEYFSKKRNLLITNADDEIYNEVIDNFISMAYVVKNRLVGIKLEHPCVYITSAAQGEGKTVICAQLAVQLSDIGMKVLAVDLDTRNPKLGGMFLNKVEYEHSLNALYRGKCSKEDAITTLTGNLDLLPSVLEQKRLQFDALLMDLIGDLKKEYDIILLDTDPVGQVAGTMSLNLLADVALTVVRFDSTGLERIRQSLERLDKSGMHILGCVVNGVKDFNNDPRELLKFQSTARKSNNVRKKTELEEEWSKWEKEKKLKEHKSDQATKDDLDKDS